MWEVGRWVWGDSVCEVGVGTSSCTRPSLLGTDSHIGQAVSGHKQGSHWLVSLLVALEKSEF